MNRTTNAKLKSRLKPIKMILTILIIIIALFICFKVLNNSVSTMKIIFESTDLPKTFVGYKIVHISDIRNTPHDTLSKVEKENPNLVIISGNFSNEQGKYENSVKLIKSITSKYPTLYVLGETDNENIKEYLNNTGAIDIEGKTIRIDSPKINYEDFIDKYIEKQYLKEANNENSDIYQYLEYTKQKLEEDSNKFIEVSGLGVSNIDDIFDKSIEIVDLDNECFKISTINQFELTNEMSKTEFNLILTGKPDTVSKNGISNTNGTSIVAGPGVNTNSNINFNPLNRPTINSIVLSDGTINNNNPLEKFLMHFINDVGTRFDNDSGFKEHSYYYSKN